MKAIARQNIRETRPSLPPHIITPDGTFIIACAETGKSASGRTLKDAEANLESLTGERA